MTLAAAAAPSSPAAIAAATAAAVPPTMTTRSPACWCKARGVLEQLRAAMAVEAVDLQPARLERADAAGDDHRLGDEALAGRRGDVEAAVVASRQRVHLLVEMKAGAERLDLLQQPLGQLAPGAVRHGRDVVDRLVGVELEALAAGMRQRVDDCGAHLLQAELEHLEQADRAGADDQRVGLDDARRRITVRQRTSSGSLPVLSFQSSASGSAGFLRVIAGQPGRQLGVELDHVLLVAGDVFLGNDRVDRALRDADGAVDALVGIDGQEVRAFTEAVDRADIDAVGVLAADARFEDDVGHASNFTVSIALGLGGRAADALRAAGIAAAAMRVAPTPTVTIVGRPECSTVASPSVAMRWSLAS